MTFSEYFDNLSLKGRIVATLEYKQLYSSYNINMIFYELYVTLVNDMNCINALTYLPQIWSTHPSWEAEALTDFRVFGSKVKVTGVKCAQTVSDQ